MSGYGDFAGVYDRFNKDVNYEARADYLLELFAGCKKRPSLLLDLACGTGDLTLELRRRGIEVIGVDGSPDMLAQARGKDASGEILWLCQDADQLDLYGTVDGAVCTMDSVNHITDSEVLLEGFRRVSLFLEQGGLFLFDVNTEYKHRVVLGDNTFVLEDGEIYLVWQNSFFDAERLTRMELDLFRRQGEVYRRTKEEIWERYYTDFELKGIIEKSGFTLLGVYGDLTTQPPSPTEERVVYVLQKKGPTGTI